TQADEKGGERVRHLRHAGASVLAEHVSPARQVCRGADGVSDHASANSCRVCRSNCGRTLVPAVTVMKLASPIHRGTTCWCRCSYREPPAALPRFSPTLNESGFETALMTLSRC